MPRRLGFWLSILAMAISGCAGDTPSPPPPTPVPRVVTSAYLQPIVVDWMLAYRETQGPPPFDLEVALGEESHERLESGAAILRIGRPPVPEGWFATPLDWEPIAVVLHPEVNARDFTVDMLEGIFSGQIQNWQELDGEALAIQPVVPLPGDDVRLILETRILEGRRVAPYAILAPTPQAMNELVLETPGAIGLLPRASVGDRLNTARLEGALVHRVSSPGGRYPLVLELLAMAPEEPQGGVRDWLVWAQENVRPGD